MATMSCATCKKWEPVKPGDAGWRDGLGRCTNVPNFYDVTDAVAEFDPYDGVAGDRVLKPESKTLKAFGLDGSGYQAVLITAPDFGCVSFDLKG